MSFLSAIRGCRSAVIGLFLFSALINILYLTGSFYMLQVYDRVLPSRSVPTLIALSALAAVLYGGQAALDFCRQRVLARMARSVDEHLSPRVFTLVTRLPLMGRGGGAGLQPLRDLDQVRSFLAGGGPLAFFDLPWMPFYLAICFLFHPLIGLAASAGAVVLVLLTICTEVFTRRPVKAAALHGAARMSLAEASRRNAEVVVAMGMGGRLNARWSAVNQQHLDAHERAGDVAGGLGGASKVARMALQSGVLGLGAYLVIHGEASSGIIIAGSILSARALAPVELVIAHWKAFAGARQSWGRLRELFVAVPETAEPLPLRPPASTLSVEALSVVPPGDQRLVVRDLSFALQSGSALGVIGPSASGKSSLARALVGVWRPARGSVRLDGAALDQWSPEALGRHVGYLPQDIELFDGTIGQNIAQFEPDADPEAIIRAAEQAGVHELIVRLLQGYDTRIGEGGMALSGGQRQRIGLARALYGDPFLVVLDEPNSNLDSEGEQALTQAIANVRARNGIAVIVAHRPSALASVDQVLVMGGGEAKALGPKEQIMRPAAQAVAPAGMPGPGGPVRPAAAAAGAV
ncbi:type I secretion system permease/ATPase [Methylobacterium sp. J-072]|uniref:type I secretion system permease/ATPase n=1 Tax=Methylobacterium sp. J-072 TaxID=2836651 RepID=UPI001FB99C4F|nr:type I secretion system permease/ATPase [Methylobacterium sp. J-072]MCJ2092246.1 type I secretion system permease/ATPase [Methylobacterium sp. J-072]